MAPPNLASSGSKFTQFSSMDFSYQLAKATLQANQIMKLCSMTSTEKLNFGSNLHVSSNWIFLSKFEAFRNPRDRNEPQWHINSTFFEEALEKYGTEGSISPEAERKLIRKIIDTIILPCLAMGYVFYYVDKTTLSYAAIFGIKDAKPQGLGLVGTEYSWLSSIFYFLWLVWSIPSNLLMQKSPPGTYLAVNIFFWGVFLMLQAAANNFAALAALRVISGAFEAIADPAFMLITTMYYTQEEQPSRISFWSCFNGVGVAAGGLLGYAIGSINGSLASWRYEFVIIGAVCSAWAISLLYILPNSPATMVWLTRDERLMAVARLRKNQTGIENKMFQSDQAIECMLDVKTWLFLLLGFLGNILNGGISNFSTLIIEGLGFDTLETTLLGIPQGALVVIWISLGAWINGKLPPNFRTYVCMLFMLPTIAGSLGFLLAPLDANVGRLVCFYLTGSYHASFVLGGQTKKMLTNALIWFGACIGNISSPFFYHADQAPTYHLGIVSMLVSNVLELGVFVLLRIYFVRENARREQERSEKEGVSVEIPHVNEATFADLTDKQNVK
ncbi:major facilitator superfamily domain-containing protein [Mycena crocata]|nr:major facilitator superfamily domain-containing protein [Mycena crocata]